MFTGHTIQTGLDSYAIGYGMANTQNNPTYGEHPDWPNGHVYACAYSKLTNGTYNIFFSYSTEWGQAGTWVEEQVTFMTGGSETGHQYGPTVAVDINGNGFHLSWFGLGYAQIGLPNYPAQKYMTSILYAFRDSTGVWTSTEVVDYSADLQYAPTYPSQRWYNHRVPCIAIDEWDNVHIAYMTPWDHPYTVTHFAIRYKKRDHTTGVWGESVRLAYGQQVDLANPNLQVDSYGNPHITCIVKKPTSSWGSGTKTTCWIANDNQGERTAGWPGTYTESYQFYGGVFPNGDPMAELLYDIPAASGTPSVYSRMALSPIYTEGTYDYPHCVYQSSLVDHNYYKYLDATGWHTEDMGYTLNAQTPSIAIGADGMIYTLLRNGDIETTFEYLNRINPASAWTGAEIITGIIYPRHLFQIQPSQYPLDGEDCSPFMALNGTTLKFYRCGLPASAITGYGYFM